MTHNLFQNSVWNRQKENRRIVRRVHIVAGRFFVDFSNNWTMTRIYIRTLSLRFFNVLELAWTTEDSCEDRQRMTRSVISDTFCFSFSLTLLPECLSSRSIYMVLHHILFLILLLRFRASTPFGVKFRNHTCSPSLCIHLAICTSESLKLRAIGCNDEGSEHTENRIDSDKDTNSQTWK